MKNNNIKLIISYDGTNYSGYQFQKGKNTIELFLKQAIERILKRDTKIYCSGRTDSGVHAEGQVVNFFSSNFNIKEKNWILALNSILPDDIRVLNCEIVEENFNARRDSILREYWYHIINAPVISALQSRYNAHFYLFELDENLLNNYAKEFLGENDFTSFCSANDVSESKFRYIHSFNIEKIEEKLIFKIKGNAFLQHMVRIIVGTMIDLHKKRANPSIIKDIMNSKDRTKAGFTFYPNGLVLKKIYYDKDEIENFDTIPDFIKSRAYKGD